MTAAEGHLSVADNVRARLQRVMAALWAVGAGSARGIGAGERRIDRRACARDFGAVLRFRALLSGRKSLNANRVCLKVVGRFRVSGAASELALRASMDSRTTA